MFAEILRPPIVLLYAYSRHMGFGDLVFTGLNITNHMSCNELQPSCSGGLMAVGGREDVPDHQTMVSSSRNELLTIRTKAKVVDACTVTRLLGVAADQAA